MFHWHPTHAFRSILTVVTIVRLSLSLSVDSQACRARANQDQTDAWATQLLYRPLNFYQENIALVRAQPEATYKLVREHWHEAAVTGSKQSLIVAFKAGASPHLLDLLDLAMTDPAAEVRYAAEDALISFAFRNFEDDNDKAEYLAWHKTVSGLTQEQVVRREETQYFTRLETGQDAAQRNERLIELLRVDFESDLPLSHLRRQVASECHALEIMARLLSPPLSPTVTELFAIYKLQPTDAFLRRYVAPLANLPNSSSIRYAAISMLSAFHSPAGTEILTRLLTQGADPDGLWILRQALTTCTDTKLIPVLIGVLEREDDIQIDQLLQVPLQRMSRTYSTEFHDSGWWRIWWNRNHTQFPEVTEVKIPRIKAQIWQVEREPMYRRAIRWQEIGTNGNRAYWLICPPVLASPPGQKQPHSHQPGLIVVLGSPGTSDDIAEYWAAAGKAALNDSYYVAVPVSPDYCMNGSWITEKTNAPGARLSVEILVRDVVEDVCKKLPIDRERCYLHGVGDAGIAAYSCSLSATSPFRGFYILASGFNMARLPNLVTAKNRRYYIQNSVNDKAAPLWQSVAAAEMLKKNGAFVKTLSVAGDHGYKFDGDPWKPISDAVAWLENGKK